MSADASATLDANAEECGPIFVRSRATYVVARTGTITVTPHLSHDGTNYAPFTAKALTNASGADEINGPCWLKLIASGVSGGSAVCSIRNAF